MSKRTGVYIIFLCFIVLLLFVTIGIPYQFKKQYTRQYNKAKKAVLTRLKNWRGQEYNPTAPGAISKKWENANFTLEGMEKSFISNAIYGFLEQENGIVEGEQIPAYIWLQLKYDLLNHY